MIFSPAPPLFPEPQERGKAKNAAARIAAKITGKRNLSPFLRRINA
jgi:hypothetical protein